MDPKYYGLIDLGIAFGAVAVFVIHQLWTLRRRSDDPPPRDDLPQRDYLPRRDDKPL